MLKRLAGAFVNPFTVILFCLAIVSTMTDMVFPYFSLFDSVPEDFDCLTVVIILTMVIIPEHFGLYRNPEVEMLPKSCWR